MTMMSLMAETHNFDNLFIKGDIRGIPALRVASVAYETIFLDD